MVRTRFHTERQKIIEEDKEKAHCPFHEFGCTYADGKHSVKKHIKETPTRHTSYLCDGVSSLEKEARQTQLVMERQDLMMEGLYYRVRALDIIFSTHLVWRIDDFKNRLQQAKRGTKVTIFSHPFFSGKQGYKMAASAMLNGDGPAKKEYMSVFVTILRSDHDALLVWPFPCRVNFTILDQKEDATPEERENHTKSVKPNTYKENRPFLGRPTGDRNPSFGIQKFASHTLLESPENELLRDDALLLKLELDMEELPSI